MSNKGQRTLDPDTSAHIKEMVGIISQAENADSILDMMEGLSKRELCAFFLCNHFGMSALSSQLDKTRDALKATMKTVALRELKAHNPEQLMEMFSAAMGQEGHEDEESSVIVANSPEDAIKKMRELASKLERKHKGEGNGADSSNASVGGQYA